MTEFPQVLKSWRNDRRFSQLQLANEANISGRHLSFLETGRAHPSREMVNRLGEALQLPLSARNQLLTLAGFSVRYAERDWSSDDMIPIHNAIDRMLDCHLPYPGLALDRHWTIKRANKTASNLLGRLDLGEGDSLIELLVSDIMPQLVENWQEVAYNTASRLRTESLSLGGIPEFDQAITHLTKAAGHRDNNAGPIIPTILNLGDLRLSMFATIAQFGTPEDVTIDDLKIELYFPMDDETTAGFEMLATL